MKQFFKYFNNVQHVGWYEGTEGYLEKKKSLNNLWSCVYQ
jgi:hypothetical protein